MKPSYRLFMAILILLGLVWLYAAGWYIYMHLNDRNQSGIDTLVNVPVLGTFLVLGLWAVISIPGFGLFWFAKYIETKQGKLR